MQSAIEETITLVTQERVVVAGSGRTDAGAHALSQVIAFSSNTTLEAGVLRRALNATLPRDIAVTDVRDTDAGFHPRFDAHSRTYRYLIYNRRAPSPFWHLRAAHVGHPLNIDAMSDAASLLVGRHDFAAFVPAIQARHSTRTFYRAECRQNGALIALDVRASGFKRQMVRSIAGTLIRVGEEKIRLDGFKAILASGDRTRAGETAPAHGLYLMEVHYPIDILEPDPSLPSSGSHEEARLMHGFEETV